MRRVTNMVFGTFFYILGFPFAAFIWFHETFMHYKCHWCQNYFSRKNLETFYEPGIAHSLSYSCPKCDSTDKRVTRAINKITDQLLASKEEVKMKKAFKQKVDEGVEIKMNKRCYRDE